MTKLRDLTPEQITKLKEICQRAPSLNKPPAFLWYVTDWLGSVTTRAMRPEQRGAYTDLLSFCWDSRELAISADESDLARLSGLGSDWATKGPAIRACFSAHPVLGPKFLTHHKLVDVRYQQMKRAENVSGRWHKKDTKGDTKPIRNGYGMSTNEDTNLDDSQIPRFSGSQIGSSQACGGANAPARPKRRKRPLTDQEKVEIRAWTGLYADCFREVNGMWPAGYDPESTRFPEPRLAQAALWLKRHVQPGDVKADLLEALRGGIYAKPPGDLAEFAVMIKRNRFVKASRKESTVGADSQETELRRRAEKCYRENPGCGGGHEPACIVCRVMEKRRDAGRQASGGGFRKVGDVAAGIVGKK